MAGHDASAVLDAATAGIDASSIDAAACIDAALAGLPASILASLPAFYQDMEERQAMPGPFTSFSMADTADGVVFSPSYVFMGYFNPWAKAAGNPEIDVDACRSEPVPAAGLTKLIQLSSNISCLRMHVYEKGNFMFEHSDGRGDTAQGSIKLTLIRTVPVSE